jgi:succinate dehydrogenase cytochrome b subunit
MTELANKRREFRNIHIFKDLPGYRMPMPAIVSILHRISGFLMFLLLPFFIWLFDKTISSEYSYAKLMLYFTTDPQVAQGSLLARGIFLKLVVLVLMWGYLHHFIAGLRYLWMDVSHDAVGKKVGGTSAKVVLVLSLALTAILGAKLFGLY